MRDYVSYLNRQQIVRRVSVGRDADWWLEKIIETFGKFTFLIIFLITIMFGFYLYKVSKNEHIFPVENISLRGNILITKDNDIKKILSEVERNSFFSLEIEDILEKVESLPWVKKASVARSWPAGLNINILEREAVYRWGYDKLIDTENNLFGDIGLDTFVGLPMLFGPEEYRGDVIKSFEIYKKAFSNIDAPKLKKFVLNEYLSWELHLENGVLVKLGRDDFVDRLNRFVTIYNSDKLPKLNKIITLDLRYNKGFAVKWKPEFLPYENGKNLKVLSVKI